VFFCQTYQTIGSIKSQVQFVNDGLLFRSLQLSISEVEDAFLELASGKGPGLDGFSPLILLPHSYCLFVCLSTG
jgi:hypothetical protein